MSLSLIIHKDTCQIYEKAMSHVTLSLPLMSDVTWPCVEFKDFKDLKICPCLPDEFTDQGPFLLTLPLPLTYLQCTSFLSQTVANTF